MPQNITVVLGHPKSDSYCGALASSYVDAAQAAGHAVKLFKVGDMAFDPTLHNGYDQTQALEPSLKEIQEAISWAQHLVFVYPVWWGSMPSLLKGLLDRMLLPGYAFKYRKDSKRVEKLLPGRSAHVIMTMDTPPWYYRLVYRRPAYWQMRKTILEFCGIAPVQFTSFGPIAQSTTASREKWLQQVAGFARAVK
jgi:NAD(P)H dehydrogenase (quinone)